ncbi:hypothetical protein ACIGFK_04090 [Streptomyces sp. NPDC085524]|uniref:hypothetical protein n=1 Tax=Streptomyces sp. NPDC085524 TaxID=3365728 RepID=UPI0037D4650C
MEVVRLGVLQEADADHTDVGRQAVEDFGTGIGVDVVRRGVGADQMRDPQSEGAAAAQSREGAECAGHGRAQQREAGQGLLQRGSDREPARGGSAVSQAAP